MLKPLLAAVLVGGLLVASQALGAPSPIPAPTTVAPAAQSGWRAYADELEELASGYARFGYFEERVGRTVRVGFVGPVPRAVRAKIAEAPERSDVRGTRSVWTRTQLDRAREDVMDNSEYDVVEVWDLSRGAGLGLVTTDRELARSGRPARLLDVRVGVVVRRGSAPVPA